MATLARPARIIFSSSSTASSARHRTATCSAALPRRRSSNWPKQLGIEVVEGNYTPFDLYTAEEAFLASTSPTFVPIKTVNGAKIGNGAPGPITLRLIGAWNEMVGMDIVDQALSHLEQAERER